jgi:hypothetical protein
MSTKIVGNLHTRQTWELASFADVVDLFAQIGTAATASPYGNTSAWKFDNADTRL